MNKRKIEGIIWFAVGLVLVLLLLNKSKMLSDNIGENIFSLILSGITLFFGKMTWFIAIIAMLYGIILFFSNFQHIFLLLIFFFSPYTHHFYNILSFPSKVHTQAQLNL